jgi:predicted esterase
MENRTEKKIITPKTGKYYILGDPGDKTKNIWFALHGYGNLASDFVDKFKDIANESTIVIVPEALNKFYVKGFYGKVGASWMTKNDRENEIKDYLNFLNNVYNREVSKIFKPDLKLNLFGFSQGTATASRWTLHNKFKVDKLILWGGSLPKDIDFKKARITFTTTALTIVVGKNDEFITEENLSGELKVLEEKKIRYVLKKYDGKHEIQNDVLNELMV